jgi:death-on-curing protein
MAEVVHLTVEAVRALHRKVLERHGGIDGLRDEGLLLSAISATQATWAGRPLFAKPLEVSAAYLFYLCRNHPFNDGNKRTALAACLVVLEANGLLPDVALPSRAVGAWERFVLDVASGQLDRDETAQRLRERLGK